MRLYFHLSAQAFIASFVVIFAVMNISPAQASDRRDFYACMDGCRDLEARCYKGKNRGSCPRRKRACVLQCERHLGRPDRRSKKSRPSRPNRQ